MSLTVEQKKHRDKVQFFARLFRTNFELLQMKDTARQREYVDRISNRLEEVRTTYQNMFK